jgi:hypothetical protein
VTVPENVRINTQVPFPSLVIANGPVTISKQSGIWTVGFNITNLTAVPNGTPAANLLVPVWNTLTNTFQQTPASLLPTQFIFTGTAAPASAGGQTSILGTLAASPTLTNTGQGIIYNQTVDGLNLQGDGSTYDVSIVNKNGGTALAVPTGTVNLQYFGSLLGNGASAQLGFMTGTGAGGAVTQLTSRTTGVTLNTNTGAVTMFAAAPVVGTPVSFTLTNSTIAATDVVIASMKSGTNTYRVDISQTAAGSCQLTVTSLVGTASDSPVINFVVIKGSSN